MLSFIFGAVAGVSKAASEAIEDVGQRIGAPQWLVGGLSACAAAVGSGCDKISNMEVPSMGGGNLGGGGFSFSNPFSGGRDEVMASAPSKTPQVEIQAPAREISRYEVSPAELGGFSAPTFGSYAASRDTGISV
jgi:hypothetical protein